MKVILVQTAVAVVIGVAFLAQGVASAVAALAGGLLMVIGTAILALRVFAPALAGSGAMLMRFVSGTLLKWIVVLVGLYLIFAVWKLPPVPAFIGVAATLMVNLAALKFER